MKHTKGPWYHVPHNDATKQIPILTGIDSEVVCFIGVKGMPNIANAKLIAAAPELLEALQSIIEIGKRDMSNPKYAGYFEGAKEAIKKATSL